MLNDNGIPTLRKRGYLLPGSSEIINNDNNDFIKELGDQVVGLDWFLSLDNKNPQIETEWIEGNSGAGAVDVRPLTKSPSSSSSES